MNTQHFEHDPQHPSPDDVSSRYGAGVDPTSRPVEVGQNVLPRSLQGKIPTMWLHILEKNNQLVLQATLLAVAFLPLFSSIIGPPHRAEWIYIITAAVAPIGFCIWYIIFPLNPYTTYTFQGLKDLDQSDPGAAKLVSQLGSSETARYLWKRTQRLWILFFGSMSVLALALHRFPAWTLNASWLLRLPIFFLFLYAWYRVDMLAWAIRAIKLRGE